MLSRNVARARQQAGALPASEGAGERPSPVPQAHCSPGTLTRAQMRSRLEALRAGLRQMSPDDARFFFLLWPNTSGREVRLPWQRADQALASLAWHFGTPRALRALRKAMESVWCCRGLDRRCGMFVERSPGLLVTPEQARRPLCPHCLAQTGAVGELRLALAEGR